jgi:hypothetical protein
MLDPNVEILDDDQDTNVDRKRESIFNDEPFYAPKPKENEKGGEEI